MVFGALFNSGHLPIPNIFRRNNVIPAVNRLQQDILDVNAFSIVVDSKRTIASNDNRPRV